MAVKYTQDLKKSIDEAKSKNEDIHDPFDFLKLVGVGQDTKTLIDEAKSKDEDVAIAIIQINKAVDIAFVHARFYITKCYEVAEYICEEEKNIVKAIQEGNVKEFKDFLGEVLYMSSKCQKDICTLLEFIEKEKRKIIEEEKKAKAKEDGKISTTKDGGIFGVIRSAAGTIASAMWGSSLYRFYGKAVKAFEELKEALAKIENALKIVNEQLKLGIDNNLSDVIEKTDKLDKDSIKISIIKKMGTAKVQSEHLKEYCGPLKDAKDLDFKKKIHSNYIHYECH